ncbi:MAG TPA: hypothetical protein HPP80_10485, partial [Rhodospirillaceae bacterium]|nr:hypothetical protein [Rhodospirillaceae bacterium]
EFRRSSAMLRALRAKLGFTSREHADIERRERAQLQALAEEMAAEIVKLRHKKAE